MLDKMTLVRLIFPAVIAGLGTVSLLVSASAADSVLKTSYQFDFGPGKAAPGYTQILPETTYSDTVGYGFEPGATVTGVKQSGTNALRDGFITSDKPFYFSVAVPEGNYKVTVTLGDQSAETTTTVKAELRRLMLERVTTKPGQFVSRSFIVNVRIPKISTGGEVHLKVPRESTAEAWAWDERITLEFNNTHPCINALEVEKVDVPTLYLLGDSTVCDQSGEPYASWGQMLTRFFKPEVAVANHGESGETVRSSTGAHRFDKILSVMKPGDYLFMQFGHNDMKSKAPDASTEYQTGLKSWVDQVKAKGGIPVLVTPMNRYSFQGDTVTQSLQDYPDKVRELAKQENVALIDLNAMSKTLYEALGPEKAKALFEHEEGASRFDHTHHSPYGAYELAKCIIEGIKQNKLGIAKAIVDDVPPFDPAHPDPVANFDVPSSPRATTEKPFGN